MLMIWFYILKEYIMSKTTSPINVSGILVHLNVEAGRKKIIWTAADGETVGSEGIVRLIEWMRLHPAAPIWVRDLHRMVERTENVMKGGRA
jgi:hypothetical protein